MNITVIEDHKSSLGLNANLVAVIIFAGTLLLSIIPYVGWFAWGVGLAFFIIEKNSRFVKFQAITALVIAVIGALISVLLRIIIYAITPRTYSDFIKLAMNGGFDVLDTIDALYTITKIFLFIFAAIYVFFGVMAFLYKQVELPLIGTIAAKAGVKMDGSSGGARKAKAIGKADSTAASKAKTAPKAKAASKTKTASKAKGLACPSCGKANAAGTKFCPSCGAKLG